VNPVISISGEDSVDGWWVECWMCVAGTETMVDWDEEKLEEVVKQKHSEAELKKPKTEIVSRLCFSR